MMRKIGFLLIALVFISCNKKYEIAGSPLDEDEPTYTTSPSCILESISLEVYINQPSYMNDFDFDKNGNIWIAAGQGLLKINDSGYELFNTSNTQLLDNHIFSVTVDPADNIWITNNYGLYKYNSSDGSWVDYTSELPNNSSKIIVDSEENIYVADPYRIYHYSVDAWYPILDLQQLLGQSYGSIDVRGLSIFCKNDGLFWIGTDNGLLKYENDTVWELFNTANSGISDNSIMRLFIDTTRRKWMLTASGVEMYDDENWYLFDKLVDIGVADDMIIAKEWSRPYYIIKTFTNGTWSSFLNGYSDIPRNKNLYITRINYDNEGYLWLADGANIYKLIPF